MIRARHEGHPSTCQHCAEPVVRLQDDDTASVSVWVHTPDRLHCVNHLTREQLSTVAEPAVPPVVRAPVRVARLRGAL